MSILHGQIGFRMLRPEPAAIGSSAVPPDGIRSITVGSAARLTVAGSRAALFEDADGSAIAWLGRPRWGQRQDDEGPAGLPARMLSALRSEGPDAFDRFSGEFALAAIDSRSGTLWLAVDRVGTHRMAYAAEGGGLLFGTSLDTLVPALEAGARVRPQAVYDYLYFHVVPGPATIYENVARLLPGTCLQWKEGTAQCRRYWRMRFGPQRTTDRAGLREEFLQTVERAVTRAAEGAACGAFLSGGTDSSTVAGMLARRNGPARTFSIGFAVPGYDEMEYARIASRHFSTEHHEYYVTAADVARELPTVAGSYDQPFGNASTVPTYFCARLAREGGVERMLGGDGGDELFGGNARYAKHRLLALYDGVPHSVRRLIEPMLTANALAGTPGLGKLRSYVLQARLPMPVRYESTNLLSHLGASEVLHPDLLARIDPGEPHRLLHDAWEPYREDSLIDQMLAIDLRFTLDDSDLPKVSGMTALAGVDVAFPLLDEAVVSFSARLMPQDKLGWRALRPFFKEATRGFLPDAILAKRKHGFGLPAGQWLANDPELSALGRASLEWLRGRGIVRDAFIDRLLSRLLPAHPAYYGTMVWLLAVLSLWMQSRRITDAG